MILDDCYISYINLASRPDRNEHMQRELKRVGIEAERFDALLPEHFPQARYDKMRNTTPGAIGCMMSQMSIMVIASAYGKHAMVLEDDCVFSDDVKERIELMNAVIPEWDVLWLGGTYHIEPTWHKTGHQMELPCNCTLNKDWEPTLNPQIVRTYGIWSTYAWVINKNSIQKILQGLDELMPRTIGIDFSMIALQPELNTYAFVPGMVKQMDGKSNIGKGNTIFSNFSKLGNHWWKQQL